jgi:hypothetical protein
MRRTALSLTLTLTLLISSMLVVHPAKSSSRTIVVPDDFPTIKKAIDNASAGDTVYVKAGTYDIAAEGYTSYLSFVCLSISKPISLIGENFDNTIINATENYPPLFHIGIQVMADNVTISGFTITSNKNIVGLAGNNDILTKNIIKMTGDSTAINTPITVYAGNGNMVSLNVIEGSGQGYGVFAGLTRQSLIT